MKRILSLILALTSVVSLTACGGEKNEVADNTIKWFMQKPIENMEHQASVEEAANKIINEKLGLELKFNFIDSASWEQKTKLLQAILQFLCFSIINNAF